MSEKEDTINVSAKEFRALQRQIAEQNEALALIAQQKADLERAANGGVLPEHEQPRYLLAQPYYAPDDVYYPEGFIINDVRGDIIPNEFMIPQNEPAQVRYDEYMNSLPLPGRQPTLHEMIDIAAKVTQQLGPNVSGEAVQLALLTALTSKMKDPARGTGQFNPATRLTPNPNVPLMPNTNIVENGTPMRPAAPARKGPQRTRAAGQSAEPTANVIGSVQSQPNTYLPA